jgi:hypothetical protein
LALRDISLRFEVRSLSGHSGHARACGWPDLVANDPWRHMMDKFAAMRNIRTSQHPICNGCDPRASAPKRPSS